VKLYVCWGTFATPRPGGHPCRNAYVALKEAGYDPEVEKVYGLAPLPDTKGRKKVRELAGSSWVPVLELDDGTVIQDSKEIAAWAQSNPAAQGAA
jgi:hypothetical protein